MLAARYLIVLLVRKNQISRRLQRRAPRCDGATAGENIFNGT